MPVLSKSLLGRQVARKSIFDAARELRDSTSRALKSTEQYDVFLSHRYLDASEILVLKTFIESFDVSVFVDWSANPELDRGQVTRETAGLLRDAMSRSKSLLYAVSGNSSDSRWMPWELGYSDALHGRIAVVPITDYETISESYVGQEYLSLYPFVSLRPNRIGQDLLWIQESSHTYVTLQAWLQGSRPSFHST
jgi:hypothetical protein